MQPTTKTNTEQAGSTETTSPSTFNPKPESQFTSKSSEYRRTSSPTELEREVKDAVHRGAEFVDNAKQSLSETYDKTGKALGDAYDRAKVYGSENPATMTILALGVGVGLGFILAQNARPSSRSRARRVVPPVMNALTQVVTELFDYR
jgi:ElaB/YqjD/DUF883 family membrane-anchored ribosome-binding protein